MALNWTPSDSETGHWTEAVPGFYTGILELYYFATIGRVFFVARDTIRSYEVAGMISEGGRNILLKRGKFKTLRGFDRFVRQTVILAELQK